MVKPILQAMVLADQIYQDHPSGKHVIAGTFTTINVKAPPKKEVVDVAENESQRVRVAGNIQRMGSPFLYLALVGIRQETQFSINFVNLADASVLFEIEFALPAQKDPLEVIELKVPVPQLPVKPEPGFYSLDLICEGEHLGSWRITVVVKEPKADEKGSANDSN